MNKVLLTILTVATCIFLMSSCVSLTGYEEGRALGNGVSEISASGNFTRVPDLFDDITSESDITTLGYPIVEASYKRGVSDKCDVGIRAGSNLNASAFVKYQLVGDRISSFALGTGFEFSSVLGLAFNVGIPIYATYYPSESIAINLSPRFMHQFIIGDENSANYLGGNFGVLFGKKNKIGFDVGYYNVSSDFESQAMITFGIGGKYRFGDIADSEPTTKEKRRRRK